MDIIGEDMTNQAPLIQHTLPKSELPKAFFVNGSNAGESFSTSFDYLIYLHVDICYKASAINSQIDDYSDFHLQIADELIHDSWGYSANIYKDYRYRFVSGFTPEKVRAIKTVVEMIWPNAFKPTLREQSDTIEISLPT